MHSLIFHRIWDHFGILLIGYYDIPCKIRRKLSIDNVLLNYYLRQPQPGVRTVSYHSAPTVHTHGVGLCPTTLQNVVDHSAPIARIPLMNVADHTKHGSHSGVYHTVSNLDSKGLFSMMDRMRSSYTQCLSFLALVVCLVFTACSTPHVSERKEGSLEMEKLGSKSGIMIEGRFKSDGTLDKKNSITKDDMRGYSFRISDIRGADLNGIKKVQVSVVNRTDTKVDLQYRFVWIDDFGMEISSNLENWQTVALYGYQTVAVTGTSNSPEAKSFRVFIRPIKYSK